VSPGQLTFLPTRATVDLEARLAVDGAVQAEPIESRARGKLAGHARALPGPNQGAYDSALQRACEIAMGDAPGEAGRRLARAHGEHGAMSGAGWLLVPLAVLGLAWCDPQVVSTGSTAILSDPPGARVFVDDAPVGETPVTVESRSERTGSGSRKTDSTLRLTTSASTHETILWSFGSSRSSPSRASTTASTSSTSRTANLLVPRIEGR